MSVIKTIIKNEIQLMLGHQPDYEDVESALNYLMDFKEDIHRLQDVSNILDDWLRDNYIQCSNCGEYFPADDCYRNDYGEWVCSDECEHEWEDDHTCQYEKFGEFEYGVGRYGDFANK